MMELVWFLENNQLSTPGFNSNTGICNFEYVWEVSV
jgi:hypothetical protein